MIDLDPFAAKWYKQNKAYSTQCKMIYLKIDPYASDWFKEVCKI